MDTEKGVESFKRISVYKYTDEDWLPSFKLEGGVSLLEVSFLGNITSYNKDLPPVWRVCVWGEDDTGMDYGCSSEKECFTIFLQVIGLELVSINKLKELGFKPA